MNRAAARRLLLSLSLAALAACSADQGELARMRGRDAWYHHAPEEHVVDVTVGLADPAPSLIFQTKVVYRFQRGHDCEDAKPLIDNNSAQLHDAIILYFSARKQADIVGVEVRQSLRRDLMGLIERSLFPNGEARVRDVFFPLWQFQRVRGS